MWAKRKQKDQRKTPLSACVCVRVGANVSVCVRKRDEENKQQMSNQNHPAIPFSPSLQFCDFDWHFLAPPPQK